MKVKLQKRKKPEKREELQTERKVGKNAIKKGHRGRKSSKREKRIVREENQNQVGSHGGRPREELL